MRGCADAQLAVIPHPSPNVGPRRNGATPDMIVLHYTAMVTPEAALQRLCDAQAEVSAHYLICERGRVWRMVEEEMRAWHAGAGQWGNVSDVNSRSIGIELANTGAHPFPAPQMAALERLMADIMQRWQIAPARVIAHSDMAPARKSDPGPRFDWRGLARSGLSVWPETPLPGGVSAAEFLHNAERFGYALREDVTADDILRAVRLRFRPQATGPLDPEDCAMIADLARRFPVDRDGATA
ncbi:N-acetylmuramoyl-L-alanine amidase AmiD precursor [Roseovarius tolerans]|uniref:N-acetylmuramoyl-L-alanine amidase n=1 Tax=Roseovarius tolerans TaxID=74031 RepID=A0A0L6CUL3_9RHOB|nr:N-acetylmuramoyl-L-alanine amidase [Roseovarius tolerans]KNX41437.1 N-acetylmuramoyl-L-alanine amidase AmiD precursor [Roseovarius tolerans]